MGAEAHPFRVSRDNELGPGPEYFAGGCVKTGKKEHACSQLSMRWGRERTVGQMWRDGDRKELTRDKPGEAEGDQWRRWR